MQNKTRVMALLAGMVAVAALLIWQWHNGRVQAAPPDEASRGSLIDKGKAGGGRLEVASDAVRPEAPDPGGKPEAIREEGPSEIEIYRAVVHALDDALDDDVPERILEEAAKLRQHHDPAVRERVAFALSWLGVQGLADLTAMLGDPDPEVAQEVFDRWSTALREVEDSAAQAALLGAAVQTFGADMSDEVFSDLLGDIAMLDNEYALPQLVNLMETVTRPDQKQEVIEELQGQMEHENPSQDPVELGKQALAEADALRQEREEEQRREGAEGPSEEQGLPIFQRRMQEAAAGQQLEQQPVDAVQ